MSQARSFTIELTQVGTGKKATVKINQAGFTPRYTFLWAKQIGHSQMRVSATVDGIIDKLSIISKKTTVKGNDHIEFVDYRTGSDNDSIIENIQTTTGSITVKLKPNPTYSERSVTIRLTQAESGEILTLIVTQDAKADDGVFKADPTALSFKADSDTKSSKITSTSKGQTVSWTITNISNIPDWITLSGENTDTLYVTTKSN